MSENSLLKKGIILIIIVLFLEANVTYSIGEDSGIKSVINAADNIPNTISRTSICNGSLSGYVNDTSMNPIEGARVRVYFHGTYEENYSDSSGYYHVTNIPICYCMKNATASKEGYTTEWVLLSITENTTYDFVLTTLSCYPVLDGTMGENGWYVSDVMVTFVGDCYYVKYRLNDGSWQTYTSPFMVTEDGIYTLWWYALDSHGNTSEGCIDFKIDQTDPTINLTIEKIGFRKWSITADVYDETSGVAKLELYLNGELRFEVTEPPYEWVVTNPNDKVQAIVYDNAGNAVSKEVTVQSNSQSQSSSVTPIQRSMINMQRR